MNRDFVLRGILVLYALALIAAVFLLVSSRGAGNFSRSGSLAEVRISGVLRSADSGASGVWSSPDADQIAQQLERLSKDHDVKAIVLRINSPGGSVGAVQEMYSEIMRCKANGKIVVASLGDVAASGGYYLASAADRVVSEPGTIVGSIGVILEFGNVEGLMQKLGVRWEVIKSGAHKDMGSPMRMLTPDEKRMLQASIDDAYAQFVEAVAQGRHLSVAQVRALADGRIFTGRQGKAVGLVDDLGSRHDAIEIAIGLAHLPPDPKIISDASDRWSSFVRSISSTPSSAVWQALGNAWQGPRVEYLWGS